MKTYDISVSIRSDMPVWPGDPAVNMQRVAKIEEGDNANVTHVSLSAHTGTHVDAPYHFLPDGGTLDTVPLSLMMGRAYVLHLPDVDLITGDILQQAEIPPRTRRVLFKTRNSELWARDEKEFQTDFVALSPDGARYLVARGIKLVGIDYLSIAPYQQSRPTHEILLAYQSVVYPPGCMALLLGFVFILAEPFIYNFFIWSYCRIGLILPLTITRIFPVENLPDCLAIMTCFPLNLTNVFPIYPMCYAYVLILVHIYHPFPPSIIVLLLPMILEVYSRGGEFCIVTSPKSGEF